jgi:hypothetical protein
MRLFIDFFNINIIKTGVQSELLFIFIYRSEKMNEQEYMVCVRVTGRVLVPVKALTPEMARCLANGKVCDMDFGELGDIDWNGVYCESPDGQHTDY